MHRYEFQSPDIREKNPVVYNAEEAPFRIYGLWGKNEEGTFARMPREVAEKTSRKLPLLYTNTAGARLRFSTDSSYVALGAIYPPMIFSSERSASLSGAGAFGFDLYANGEHVRALLPQNVIQRGSVVSFDIADGRYETILPLGEKKMRQITLCFPSFVNISELYVGLEQGAQVAEGLPYVNELPVVLYGSSITQGACASRAGNTYPNILSRKFNFDYLNLGFAGACKAEDAIIDYLCSLPMQMLVYDYDHNSPSPEYLRQTHLPALRKLRKAHPDIPMVLLSKPNIHTGREQAIERMRIVEESYEALQKESNAPVHFVNGQEIYESCDSEMMTIDGTHPTDLGFYCMAKALEKVFQLYF